MFDHRIGMDEIKAVVAMPGQRAGIARADMKRAIVACGCIQIDKRNIKVTPRPQIGQRLPIALRPADIEDAQEFARHGDPVCEFKERRKAGLSEAVAVYFHGGSSTRHWHARHSS
jgi:hypothetical protein